MDKVMFRSVLLRSCTDRSLYFLIKPHACLATVLIMTTIDTNTNVAKVNINAYGNYSVITAKMTTMQLYTLYMHTDVLLYV